jgi:hypothetical protein
MLRFISKHDPLSLNLKPHPSPDSYRDERCEAKLKTQIPQKKRCGGFEKKMRTFYPKDAEVLTKRCGRFLAPLQDQ